MSSPYLAAAATGTLLGALVTAVSAHRRAQALEKMNAALREEIEKTRKYSRSRDPLTEAIVDEACARNPDLTREEARRRLDVAGS